VTFLSESVVDGGRVWTKRARRTPHKTIIIFCSVENCIASRWPKIGVFQVPPFPRLETLRRTVPKTERLQYGRSKPQCKMYAWPTVLMMLSLGGGRFPPSDKRAFGDSAHTTRGRVTYDGQTLFLDWEKLNQSAWTFFTGTLTGADAVLIDPSCQASF
jgi:hypothetical protein